MNKTNLYIQPLRIDPVVFFRGTDEAIQEAEQKEAEAVELFKSIIESDNFRALHILPKRAGDVEKILHHSTRPGITYQLSNIYKSEPLSHQNYITGQDGQQSIRSMYRDLVALIYRAEGINVEILTA